MKKAELRFTGSGGQGVIMATIILAEAAYADKFAGGAVAVLRTGG